MIKSFQYRKADYNNIPLLLIFLGYKHDQEPVYRQHGVKMHQIFYCKDGQGELVVNDRKYIIEKGQCFIILKETPHEYHKKTEKWVLDILGFDGAIASVLMRLLKIHSSGAYLLRESHVMEKHLKKLVSISNKVVPEKHVLLSQELYALLTDLTLSLSHIPSKVRGDTNPTIAQVIDYLESNYSHDISLDELAALVSRTPEYLCSIFKDHTGLTIVKYLNNIRLLHASILLVQEPTLPINSIANSCGFRNMSYFGRAFARRYGSSPTQYRLNHVI